MRRAGPNEAGGLFWASASTPYSPKSFIKPPTPTVSPPLSSSSLSCIPVPHVQPRTEGRVLVRQPLHWCPDTLVPQSEGGPQLQPILWRPRPGTAHCPAEIDAPSGRCTGSQTRRVKSECKCGVHVCNSVLVCVCIFEIV